MNLKKYPYVLIITMSLFLILSNNNIATGSWVTETLDSEVYVGRDTSVAVDSQDKVHISYDTGDLKYISNTTGSWVVETLDSEGSVGQHTSLAVDSQDRIYISHRNPFRSDLKYAMKCFEIDSDCDDILNNEDNCPNKPNSDQADVWGWGQACINAYR
jgi:hypothetical protein